jgi:hypothetical protein
MCRRRLPQRHVPQPPVRSGRANSAANCVGRGIGSRDLGTVMSPGFESSTASAWPGIHPAETDRHGPWGGRLDNRRAWRFLSSRVATAACAAHNIGGPRQQCDGSLGYRGRAISSITAGPAGDFVRRNLNVSDRQTVILTNPPRRA